MELGGTLRGADAGIISWIQGVRTLAVAQWLLARRVVFLGCVLPPEHTAGFDV